MTLQTQSQGSGVNADLWNLAFSPDSKTIAFQIDDSRLGIFDVGEGRLRCSVEESLVGAGILSFSRDSAFMITGSGDGRLRVWNAATGDCHQTLAGHEGMVRSIDADLVNGRVASGGDDGIIRVWNIQTGVCELTLAQPGPYEGLDITGASGVSLAQAATLQALGAVMDQE